MTTDLATASKQFMRAADSLPRLLSLADGTVEILTILAEMQEPDANESELGERLEEAEAFLSQKLESCAWTVCDLERLADIRKAEAKRLRDQAERIDKAAADLKARMLAHMQALGDTKVVLPRYTISIRLNPPSVAVLEEAMVPGEFQRVIPARIEVDKRAILNFFKDTGEIPQGVDVVRTQRLDIA